MFRIFLDLEGQTVRGLDALDLRRRLGLPDGSALKIVDDKTTFAKVNETFARRYFPRDVEDVSRTVPVSILSPGDLSARDELKAGLSDDLTDERKIELWLAGTASVNEE